MARPQFYKRKDHDKKISPLNDYTLVMTYPHPKHNILFSKNYWLPIITYFVYVRQKNTNGWIWLLRFPLVQIHAWDFRSIPIYIYSCNDGLVFLIVYISFVSIPHCSICSILGARTNKSKVSEINNITKKSLIRLFRTVAPVGRVKISKNDATDPNYGLNFQRFFFL